MIVRRIQDEDISQCINIIKNCLSSSVKYDPEILRFFNEKYSSAKYLLEKISSGIFFIVEEDNNVMGMGGLEDGWIKKMFISPNYQRRGAGKSVLHRLEEVAKYQSRSEIYLYSFPNSEGFYKNQGYSLIERLTLERGNLSIPTVKMRKELK